VTGGARLMGARRRGPGGGDAPLMGAPARWRQLPDGLRGAARCLLTAPRGAVGRAPGDGGAWRARGLAGGPPPVSQCFGAAGRPILPVIVRALRGNVIRPGYGTGALGACVLRRARWSARTQRARQAAAKLPRPRARAYRAGEVPSHQFMRTKSLPAPFWVARKSTRV
jgi:hypothetical protein